MPIIHNNIDITEKVNMILELMKNTLLRGSSLYLEGGDLYFHDKHILNGAFVEIVKGRCYIFNPHSEFSNYYQMINVQLESFIELLLGEATRKAINQLDYKEECLNSINSQQQVVIEKINSLKAN